MAVLVTRPHSHSGRFKLLVGNVVREKKVGPVDTPSQGENSKTMINIMNIIGSLQFFQVTSIKIFSDTQNIYI